MSQVWSFFTLNTISTKSCAGFAFSLFVGRFYLGPIQHCYSPSYVRILCLLFFLMSEEHLNMKIWLEEMAASQKVGDRCRALWAMPPFAAPSITNLYLFIALWTPRLCGFVAAPVAKERKTERKREKKKSFHTQFSKPFTRSTWPAVSHSFIRRPEATAFARQQRVEEKNKRSPLTSHPFTETMCFTLRV